MKKQPVWREHLVLMAALLVYAAIVTRAAKVQVTEHEEWWDRAEEEVIRETEILPRRGGIYDSQGLPLAISEERYEVGVAPGELRPGEIAEIRDTLVSVLGIPRSRAREIADTTKNWVGLPGRHGIEQRLAVERFRGVYLFPTVRRSYPQGLHARPMLGSVNMEGEPVGGIEQAYDSILRGAPGYLRVYRDAAGRGRSMDRGQLPAVPGSSLILTLDAGLQQSVVGISRKALERTSAEAVDVVIMRPADGSILAMVTMSEEKRLSLGGLLVPAEPGSIIKPLMYGALLELGRLTLDEKVDTEDGTYRLPGRTLTDVHAGGTMTFGEALAVSSNIAMAKAVSRLTKEEQYRYMAKAGLGRQVGLGIGPESKGLLRTPDRWSGLSQVSLAIGYEVSATPIQIASLYAAMANEGVRMQPRLVAAVISAGGDTTALEPQAADTLFGPTVARQIASALSDVVAVGSGRAASLGPYDVSGKTGTARAWGDGAYSGYYASFAGYFPASHPQVVIVVRVTRPKGAYYGGSVAAPIAREIMETLLSSDSAPIDRSSMMIPAYGSREPLNAVGTKTTSIVDTMRVR